jgi:hypothetical protein
MSFVEVREPHTGKLLFRYDASRQLVEIAQRGVVTVVDLLWYNTGIGTMQRDMTQQAPAKVERRDSE